LEERRRRERAKRSKKAGPAVRLTKRQDNGKGRDTIIKEEKAREGKQKITDANRSEDQPHQKDENLNQI